MASILDELTPTWLKDRFLVGVDLTLDDGTAYPDEIYTQAISASVAYLEHEIGITIDPFEVAGEQHDAYELNRSGFWPFRLDHRPVLKVTGMEVRFGGFAPAELPVSWAQLVSPVHGQIHLIPSEEAIHSSYRFSHGIPLITGDILQPQRYVPGYFHFSYTAGFETRTVTVTVPDGETTGTTALSPAISMRYAPVISTNPLAGNGITVKVKTKGSTSITLELSGAAPAETDFDVVISTLPADIKQAIGYKAALLPLDVAGDLIAGAGIATLHVGVDGLSQSLGTTASATNCLQADTRIALTDGTRPTIKSLVDVSEFAVACVDDTGHPRVGIGHSARKTIKDDILQVNLSTGEHVLCNATHPFRTYGGEYIPAGELRPGIPLTPCSLVTDEPFITVVSVSETGRKEWLYDITVDEHHCFGLEAGVIVHNSGYGARVLQFERELKALLPALRAKYKLINMGAI